jgi:hypothetical protein
MTAIGPRCHELRAQDAGVTWRIVYRIDDDAEARETAGAVLMRRLVVVVGSTLGAMLKG